MKNLPEKDFWSEVKTRLNNYSEMPDDDGWDRIAGALPKAKSTSIGKRWAGIVLIFLLGTSTGYLLHQYAPLSGDANVSLTSAISSEVKPGKNDGSSDTTSDSQHQATINASTDQGDSNQTVLADNSSEGVDENLSKNENAGRRKRSTSAASSATEETTDHHAGKMKQQNGNASAHTSGFSGFTPQSIKGDVSSGRVASSDSRAADQSATGIALNDGKDTSKRSDDTETTAADARSTIYNDGSGKSETSERGVIVSGQSNAGQDAAIIPNVSQQHVNTSSSHESIMQASAIPNGDSVIVEKPEAVAKVASGQNEKKEQKPKKEKRIFHADVYANITPSLSFQKITPSGNDDLRVIGLQSNGIMSGDRFGISLEAGFQRKLTPRLDFYAGLSYYRQKQTLTYEYNGTGVAIEQSGKNGQYSITPLKESKSFQYNMTNVGISSGVMYHLFGDKLMHKIGGGFQFQKGLLRMGSESSYNNVASFYFNYQLSYRLECQLNPKWNVYLQPTFIHSIISHEELAEPFTIKPYRAGLGIGAIYHF